MDVIDDAQLQAMLMARTRQRLAVNPIERQKAVCTFPLIVSRVAVDMRRILELSAGRELTQETYDALAVCESQIRAVYRDQFGTELGQ
jgi:hypothetical protein